MYLVNANTERLEEVEILTVPGLFTTRRVDRATLPPWMHLYAVSYTHLTLPTNSLV